MGEGMRLEGARPKPEALARILSNIIRKRWIRAIHAVRLCNYLPKFLAQLQAQRTAKSLCCVALAVRCLAPRLKAARERIENRRLSVHRRFAGGAKAIFFASYVWS